jgi:hypothetical protein
VEGAGQQFDRCFAPSADETPGGALLVTVKREHLCLQRAVASAARVVVGLTEEGAGWALQPLGGERGGQRGQGGDAVEVPSHRRAGSGHGSGLCDDDEEGSGLTQRLDRSSPPGTRRGLLRAAVESLHGQGRRPHAGYPHAGGDAAAEREERAPIHIDGSVSRGCQAGARVDGGQVSNTELCMVPQLVRTAPGPPRRRPQSPPGRRPRSPGPTHISQRRRRADHFR